MLRRAPRLMAPMEDDRDLGADSGSDLFTLVKISPCQTFVSNDPTEGENIKRTPCNITSFSCNGVADDTSSSSGAASTTTGPSRVSVNFDYELWYTESANLNATIVELESSMLQHLAKVFNLLDCPYVSSSGSTATTKTAVGGGRGRHLQIFGDELADLFVGVDSTPVDVPDEDQKDCIVPVMASDKVSSFCQPMKGSFSASVNADVSQDSMAEASIKSGLLRLLRLGMNEDLYVVNDVRKVSFIGDRTSYNPPPVTSSSSAPSSSGLGTAGLAIIIVAALIVFLIAAFLIGRNRKRRRAENTRGVVLEESFTLDEEAGKSQNAGFRGGADVQGSLAATDELALEPQSLVVPVLSKSSEAGSGTDEANANSQDKATTAEASSSTTKNAAAARELAVALEMATAAAASAEKAGEEVTGEKINSTDAETPPKKKKKKRKKKARRSTDSPDSILSDSLRKLDSIAEESEPSVIDESSDSSTRSLS